MNKDNLPSSVLNALKRIAAFQNPEFYKKQNMRLSTALTPRVIACAEDFPDHVAIPRGCVEESISLFRSLGSTLEIDDQRQDGVSTDHTFRGALTDVQEAAVRAMLNHDIGVLVAPPGIGKTVVGIHLIAKRARSTLVLVHRQPLLDQWFAQLALFLDVDPKSNNRPDRRWETRRHRCNRCRDAPEVSCARIPPPISLLSTVTSSWTTISPEAKWDAR